MNKSIGNRNKNDGNIMRIEPTSNGYYKVFFEFIPIPVEMNKGYLKTIIGDIESIEK